MRIREKTAGILAAFDVHYGTDMATYLEYDREKPWQLLIATILSAQCTDARVNIVTKELFRKYPTLEAMAGATVEEMEKEIYSTGFYHNKAVSIVGCARKLLEDHNGVLPSDIEALTALPGVGRKTANVVRGNVFHIDSIVVDTHIGRISRRLGLTKAEDPVKVEMDLMKVLPRDHWILFNLQGIAFGRAICRSQSPKCRECYLKQFCIEKELQKKAK